MGGGLLRKVNRDTQKVAMKLCNAIIDGNDTPVSKNPVTDPGKKSKSGRQALLFNKINRSFNTVQDIHGTGIAGDMLEPVFRNGEMLRVQTLDEIRKLAEVELP
jgi:nicotinamide phosphoribosyltransferase